MQNSFIPPFISYLLSWGTLILHKCFSVSVADKLVMSHAFEFIYLPLILAPYTTPKHKPANTCSDKVLRLWGRLTSQPIKCVQDNELHMPASTSHIIHSLPPSPLQSPLINIFHIVNHLCPLLLIIDN